MNDLISRQAAILQLSHNKCGNDENDIAVQHDIETIRALPSAQLERKTGRWIRHDEVRNIYGGTYVECSECGDKYVVQHIEDEKYCRNCGANMRGEREWVTQS